MGPISRALLSPPRSYTLNSLLPRLPLRSGRLECVWSEVPSSVSSCSATLLLSRVRSGFAKLLGWGNHSIGMSILFGQQSFSLSCEQASDWFEDRFRTNFNAASLGCNMILIPLSAAVNCNSKPAVTKNSAQSHDMIGCYVIGVGG